MSHLVSVLWGTTLFHLRSFVGTKNKYYFFHTSQSNVMEAGSLPLLANKKHVRTNYYCLCPTWFAFFEAYNFSIGASSWATQFMTIFPRTQRAMTWKLTPCPCKQKHLDTNYCPSHLVCVLWGTQFFHWSSSVGIMEWTRSPTVLRSAATNVLRRLSQLPKRNPPMLRRSPFQQMQRIEIEKRGGQGEICLCRYSVSENVEFMRGRQASDGGPEGRREAVCGYGESRCVASEGASVAMAMKRTAPPNSRGICAGRPRWSTGATFIRTSSGYLGLDKHQIIL